MSGLGATCRDHMINDRVYPRAVATDGSSPPMRGPGVRARTGFRGRAARVTVPIVPNRPRITSSNACTRTGPRLPSAAHPSHHSSHPPHHSAHHPPVADTHRLATFPLLVRQADLMMIVVKHVLPDFIGVVIGL